MKSSIKSILIVLGTLLLFSCEEKINEPEWPEWANISQPKFENAKLTGLNEETSIKANDLFRFTAKITDVYNDLTSFNISISMNNKIVFQKDVQLSGKEANIDLQAHMPFVANFNGPVYPVVTIKAVNNEVSGTTEIVLPEASIVEVSRPVTPSKLYAVDNLGHVFELSPIEGKEYDFITTVDLSAIGQSFKIASKLTNDNKIDYNGIVWGMKDNEIVTVDETGSAIAINSSDGVVKIIAFNIYTFLISGAAPATIIDKAAFTESAYAGYKELTLSLSRGEELEFIGFGKNISDILRPDFFVNTAENKTNFDGYTAEYTLLHNETNGFIYIENKTMVLPDALWIDGSGIGFPLPPYIATSGWSWSKPTDYVFCKKTAEGVFSAVIYISNGFGFKFFTRRGWESPEYPEYKAHNFTVTPSELIQSHKWTEETWDGNGDLVPGPAFVSGVYKIEMNLNANTITLEPFGN
ncbi:MAG: hypothetical protein LBU57_06260 [Dysgonamonadaceae bacterium]|nr:hypothetical protein [Dysgonamonadaceae bacterium]